MAKLRFILECWAYSTFFVQAASILNSSLPDNETVRVRALNSFGVLETLPEKIFEQTTDLASRICNVPTAFVSIMDDNGEWFNTRRGVDTSKATRDTSFCAHAIRSSDEIFEVTEPLQDARFAMAPSVLGEPSVRFYAGAPLRSSSGTPLGTLCVIDHKPNKLSQDQRDQLRLLADQVVSLLEIRLAADRVSQAFVRQSVLDTEQYKLARLLNQMPVAICLLEGPDHKFAFANSRHYSLFGGSENQIGLKIQDVLPDAGSSDLPRILNDVFTTGVAFYRQEYLVGLPNAEGEVRNLYLNFAYEPMRDAVGRIYGISVTAHDVSELVLGRLILEEKDVRLSLALNAGQVGTWDLDPATKDLVFSIRGGEMHGFDSRTVVSYDEFLERVHDDDRSKVNDAIAMAVAIDGAGKYEIEYRIILPTGRLRTISANGLSTFERKGRHRRTASLVGTVVDVTEAADARRQILEAKNLAETANTAKSSFLANMSHEIRSPLGSIMGYSDLLKASDLSAADVSQYISVIDRNSQHLLRIIDDILDLAKVEAGKMLIEQIEVPVRELIDDFSSLMSFRARDKGIEFEVQSDAHLPPYLRTDPTRVRQILTNVVGNAIKFTDRGSVRLTVRYDEPTLSFIVSDTGPGISSDQAKQLFQPFHQADISTTRRFGGTGLGLALTRRLTEALGGEFRLTSSQVGKGSVFEASIRAEPIDKVEINHPIISTPALVGGPGASRPLEGMRILIVDDAADNRVLFKLVLNKVGANVELASDGIEGLRKALAGDFDVVLMDVQMPKMDGHEATRSLRLGGYSKPVIALTAHAMAEERDRASTSGFTDFLSKPVPREELVSMLARYR